MAIEIFSEYLSDVLKEEEYESIFPNILKAHEELHEQKGEGSEFLGWLHLPTKSTNESVKRIVDVAEKIRKDTDVFIVIAIGGSYLGARAAIEAIKYEFRNHLPQNEPQIFFAGNNLDSNYISQLLKICEGKRVSILVTSKSGVTTEPALAFRIFKEWLETKIGKKAAKDRIYIITDEKSGILRTLADEGSYTSFIIPENIGGRYSGLTPAGLLPMAVAGINIFDLIEGAKIAEKELSDCNFNNACYKYAATRYLLYKKGFQIELFLSYRNNLLFFGEWLKQLFGESDGKERKGLFPAYSTFTTDLHSLGQYIQEGPQVLFETVINIKNYDDEIEIKAAEDNFDNLNYLAGKTLSKINETAMQATLIAHSSDNVPNILLTLPDLKEKNFGYMVYFFEKACAISGYLLGVNPFIQPGVEAYKQKMFELLGKPKSEDGK